jgi:stage V sporulation protein G
MPLDADGRAKLYADIAHPINSACREMIQEAVVQEYYEEIERAKQPDYVSRYDDFDMDYGDYKRPQPSAPGGDTRVDQAHQRRHSHLGNNRQTGGPVRDRTPPPSAPSSARDVYRDPPSTGFGAGIFPVE